MNISMIGNKMKQQRLFTDRRSLQKEMLMNQKMSAIVNIVYSVALIIEGIAVDLNENDIVATASVFRSYVHKVNNDTSAEFGMWSELLEERIFGIGDKVELLPALCYKIYSLSKKIESNYRRYEPRFDFIHINEAIKLKSFSDNKEISKDIMSKISSVINEIIKE